MAAMVSLSLPIEMALHMASSSSLRRHRDNTTNLFRQRQVQGTQVADNFFDACEARLCLVSEGISGAEMRKCACTDLCPQSLQMNAKKINLYSNIAVKRIKSKTS